MKIVILAAGAGKRFRRLDLPKPLTKLINDKSILALQLETLSKFVSLHDVIIVVGHHKQKIIEQFPNQLYLYNSTYLEENTSKSLLKALTKINDDVLWLNGDVVVHPKALEAILKCKKNCMLVNQGPVSDEEVKYRTNSKGKILEVSKEVKYPEGEALGINFFLTKDLEILKNNLAACANSDYFEKAIESSIEQGIEVYSVPVPHWQCMEIDFPEDLDKANEMIKNWSKPL